MKKKFLASLLFILPIYTFAEKKISIGLSAGLAPYTLPLNNKNSFNSAFLQYRSDANFYLKGDIFYNLNEKYQLGLQAAITVIKYKIDMYKLGNTNSNVKYGGHIGGYSEQPIAGPAIPITILFNRTLNANAISCYAGVEAGYERYVMNSANGTSISGVLGGIHLGATCNLSRAIKLNGNVALDYHYSYSDNVHYKILSFPLTVGLIF
ncbi:MAG: hypothetical protein P4L41_09845 [Flavipsychrobacter sp.]|nr:hypothetical protein [Flavipsychrobacter sp.]